MKKILVIEDEVQTRNIFQECLEAEGFDTLCAENGYVGLQKVREKLPDLVLCDIMMPELDGYGVLSQLRQDPLTAVIPFIFLTAKGTKAELRQGMQSGADDYISKPLTVEELLGAIAARLEKQAALKQWCATESKRVLETSSAEIGKTDTSESIFPACPQLSEVFNFIETNYHQSIGLCDVAEAVGYSSAYLTDLVRRQTGKTVHQWIIERRMVAARNRLLNTNQTVNQIAELVGYQNVGHFFRQFRQFYGLPPIAWKKINCS